MLPLLDDTNHFFWEAGRDGVLRMLRCEDCGYWIHPPQPRCPICLSRPLSGRGRVHTFTVNHQKWFSDPSPPYAIAIITLDEQSDLRLTTRLIDVDVQAVAIGLKVRVVFEQREDVWLPLFTPDTLANGSVRSESS